jgi:hypothetical protein
VKNMITQGKWYFTTELSGMTQIRGGDTGTTADRSICALGMDNILTEEDRGNAALIAAGPELLAALKALLNTPTDNADHWLRATKDAERAIKTTEAVEEVTA